MYALLTGGPHDGALTTDEDETGRVEFQGEAYARYGTALAPGVLVEFHHVAEHEVELGGEG